MRLAPLALGLGLALQFGVPAWKLSQPRPQRFGWQMYTAFAPLPSIAVVGRDGVVVPLERRAFLPSPRAELAPSAWAGLPAHVCDTRPGLVEVRMRFRATDPWESHRCR